jgi:hypothetical protein
VGSAARSTWITAGGKVKGIMKLQSPLFLISPYLLSFLNVDIVLNRTENPQFFFMSNVQSSFTFKLESIVFRVRKAKLVPSFNEGIEQMLHNHGDTLDYPLTDCRVSTKTYSGYGGDIIEDNLFHGVLPSRIVIGIVENEAYKGSFTQNPFNFIHNDITEVGLYVNGLPHPLPMIAMNFDQKDTYRIYHHMLESLQASNPDPGQAALGITKKEFDTGYTLFSFDMSSDQYGGLNHQALFNQPANVRLHLRFKQGSATRLITLIIYHEVSSRMSVNSSRQVTVFKA